MATHVVSGTVTINFSVFYYIANGGSSRNPQAGRGPLPTAWVENAGPAYAREIFFNTGGRVAVRLNATDSGSGGGGGPELLPAVVAGMRLTFESGGNTLVLDGLEGEPEPYDWFPADSAPVIAFVSGLVAGDAITCTMLYPIGPVRRDVIATTAMSAVTTTATVQVRPPDRHAIVIAPPTLPAVGKNVSLGLRAPVPKELTFNQEFVKPGSRFGFGDSGVGFDRAPFAPEFPAASFGQMFGDAAAQIRELRRLPITATTTLSLLSGTTTVSLRRRIPVEADGTLPDVAGTAALFVRAPARVVVDADYTFGQAIYTTMVTLAERHALRLSIKGHIGSTATVALGLREPGRVSVQAGGTLPAVGGDATVRLYERLPVLAAGPLPAFVSGQTSLAVRMPDALRLEPYKLLPSVIVVTSIQMRMPDRLAVEIAAATFDTFAPVGPALAVRPPLRKAAEAARTIGPLTGGATISTRPPARIAVEIADRLHPKLATAVAMAVRVPTRKAAEASRSLPAGSAVAAVFGRRAARLPLTAPPVSFANPITAAVSAIVKRVPRRITFRSDLILFLPHEVETASVQRRRPARKELRGGQVLPGIVRLTPLLVRPPARVEVQATPILPALTGTATVIGRRANRGVITLSPVTFGAFAPAGPALATQVPGREEVRAGKTIASLAGAAILSVRPPARLLVAAAGTYAALATGALALGMRTPVRVAVTAARTFAVRAAAVHIGKRDPARVRVRAIAIAPAQTFGPLRLNRKQPLRFADPAHSAMGAAAAVSTRAPARMPLTLASPTLPAPSSTVPLLARIADRISLDVAATLPALTAGAHVIVRVPLQIADHSRAAIISSAVVGVRLPVRERIDAAKAIGAASAAATVQMRVPARLAITPQNLGLPAAEPAYPAMQLRTVVRHPLIGATTAEAIMPTVALATRTPARQALTLAATTRPAPMLGRPQLNARDASRVQIVSGRTVPAASFAQPMVATRAPAREALTLAPVAFAAQAPAGLALGTRVPIRHEVRGFALLQPYTVSGAAISRRTPPPIEVRARGFGGPFYGGATVDQRIAERQRLFVAETLPAPASAARVLRKLSLFLADPARAAQTATATISTRTPARLPMTVVGSTHPAFTVGRPAVEKRLSARREVLAARLSPAITGQARVRIRVPVEVADPIYTAPTTALVLSVRPPARLEVRATLLIPGSVSGMILRNRDVGRREIVASATHAAPTASLNVLARTTARREVQAAKTIGAVFAARPAIMMRTPAEKAVAAGITSPALGAILVMSRRAPLRRQVQIADPAYAAPTFTDPAIMTVIPGRRDLSGGGTLPAAMPTVAVDILSSVQKLIRASLMFPAAAAAITVQGGAAMPPSIVLGLILIMANTRSVVLRWRRPDLGTGTFSHYEYRIGSGAWIPFSGVQEEGTVYGLDPGTEYSISIRAVSDVGRGPGSAQLMVETEPLMAPSRARRSVARPTGETSLDLEWTVPEDDGASPILYYEICVIDEDGRVLPFEPTTGPELTWRIRGLAIGHTYGFRVRPVNVAGSGPQSAVFYGTPVRTAVRATPPGQRIPLIDTDRQSLILRIDDRDCRLRVWWAPSDESWWASIEVPVNTPAVMSRRLALNAGILDRIADVLPGNIVMRELGGAGAEPGRDAWARPTHALVYEPRS